MAATGQVRLAVVTPIRILRRRDRLRRVEDGSVQ
jgi:hypothetical protein